MGYSVFDFLEAAAYGTTEEVRTMIDSGMDINARHEGSCETALIVAAGGGNINTVRLLVDRGADINAKSCEGGTALLVAIEQCNEDIVEYLLAHGANPNDKLTEAPGLTALCMAAQRGYLRILKALLNAGADVERRSGDGSTALVNAAFKGHDEVVRELIKAGANKNSRSAGMTAEDFAKHFGHTTTISVIRETQGAIGTGCLVPLIVILSVLLSSTAVFAKLVL